MRRGLFVVAFVALVAVVSMGCSRPVVVEVNPGDYVVIRPPAGHRLEQMGNTYNIVPLEPVTEKPRVSVRQQAVQRWEELRRRAAQAHQELDQEVEKLESQRTESSQERADRVAERRRRAERTRQRMQEMMGTLDEATTSPDNDSEPPAVEDESEGEAPQPIRPGKPEKDSVGDNGDEFFAPIERFAYENPKDSPFFEGVQEDDENWYAWGIDSSQDFSLARQKAQHQARIKLATAIGHVVRKELEIQDTNRKLRVSEEKVSATLRGSHPVNEFKERTTGGGWKISVLMAVPK